MKTVLLMVICFAATLLITASAMAITGNQLKELADECEQNPTFYACGAFSGYVVGFSETSRPTPSCVPEGVTNNQVTEVVRKYLKDHPEELHLHAVDLVQKALNKAWPCK